jgi:putative membrane protein
MLPAGSPAALGPVRSLNERYPACGPGAERGAGRWPILPWVLLGGVLLLVAAAWWVGAGTVGGARVPFFWPLVPLGFFLVVVGFLLALRFAAGRWGWGGPRYWSGASSAEEILRERYARGEISEAEYRERLRVLGSPG